MNTPADATKKTEEFSVSSSLSEFSPSKKPEEAAPNPNTDADSVEDDHTVTSKGSSEEDEDAREDDLSSIGSFIVSDHDSSSDSSDSESEVAAKPKKRKFYRVLLDELSDDSVVFIKVVKPSHN